MSAPEPEQLCVPLSALGPADVALAGGKAAALGELVRAGFDVPDGFVVTTRAYRLVEDSGTVAPSPERISAWRVPDVVARAIQDAYRQLGAGRVAVRSSATAEDLPGATFAGQQDTFLNVVGADEVLDAVRRCWASLWSERAMAYRGRLGIEPASVAIAVVVQRLAAADHAGVLFTANPVTGDRSQVVIDSSPGLGEVVVSGLVTPDHAVLDSGNRVLERRQGGREVVMTARRDAGGTDQHAGSDIPALTEEDLGRLATVGRRVAQHFGRPQDIEWALERGQLQVLQARPMTALPPAPIPLNRFQRLLGPTLVELLPRRPYPMEVTAWIQPTIGVSVERMLWEMAGVRVRLDRMIPTEDEVVLSFVPPSPRLTPQIPAHLWRSVRRARRLEPEAWRADPRYRAYLDAASALSAADPAAWTWGELLAVPARAAELTDIVTRLRVAYLPAAGVAMGSLRALLAVLGQGPLFGELLLHAPTMTSAANEALSGLADHVRQDRALEAAFRSQDLDDVARFVAESAEAVRLRERLRAFSATFGHRETSSILLVADPTWGDSPRTVLALLQVLLEQPRQRTNAAEPAWALRAVTGHPLLRLTRSSQRAARLVQRAAAGIALREDTHFELTRLMPAVRHAIDEAGHRLHRGGLLDTAAQVWMLTLGELTAVADPGEAPDRGDLRAISFRRQRAYAELAASPLIATTTLYPPRQARRDALLRGVGGGGGSAAGRVRVITGTEGFSTLKPGEVLVCRVTNPSWTPLFQRAAAVVVDHGGLASHAAIVAREYGIPAVMGTAVGTTVLRTGQHVQVDGDAGVVLAVADHDR